MSKESPVKEYRTIIQDSNNLGYVNRILVGTAVTGLVRVEWMQARYGQIIPINWSHVQMMNFMDGYLPLRYQVADAQNLIVREALVRDFEWLFLLEHDVVLPPDGFIKINEYMQKATIPIVSGLYYTREEPSEPLVFRGRGVGSYTNFKVGDRVWVDGTPTGCLLIHMSILREMWKDAPEYLIRGITTRRIFDTPRDVWVDPETSFHSTLSGTSDLKWCTQVMKGEYFKKAGWPRFQKVKYPFLIDTNIFCKHINMNGEQFPHE